MRILSLNIIEFGGLSERKYDLSHGLNIFEGDNETGKSTVWLFIKFMLYGMPKKGHFERDRYINRITHRAAGVMTLIRGGEEYRIERSFSEGSKGKAAVYRVSDGSRVFDGQEPGEALLGVPKEIFESSVGISQSACAQLGGEKGAAAIRNILSSADESIDIERIEKKLEAIRVYYRYRNGKGGKLYELSESIRAKEEKLDKATQSRLRIVELEQKLVKNSDNLAKNEKRLSEARSVLDQLQKREILKRFERVEDNEEKLRQTVAERETLILGATHDGYVPTSADAANLSVLADSLERIRDALTADADRLSALRDKEFTDEQNSLANIGDAIEKAGGAESVLSAVLAKRAKKGIGVAMLCSGSAVLILCTVLSFAVGPLFVIGVILSAIVAALGVAFLMSKKQELPISIPANENIDSYVKRCADAYREREALRAEISKAEIAVGTDREHFDYIMGSLKKAMTKICSLDEVTVEAVRAEEGRLRSFLERDRELEYYAEKLKVLIANEREVLSDYNEEQIRSETAAMGEIVADQGEAESRQRFYEEQQRLLKEKDNSLRTELINLKAVNEDPTVLRDELNELREKYRAAENYYEALMTAIDGLNRAAASIQGNITPIIGRTAADIVEYISDGKYADINMGRSLDITLVDKDGLSTTTDMMSGGMKDASYLALRIALMMRIYGGELPTLMMDEALCQLDDGRMKRVLGLVDKLCGDGLQCLLFSCHRREAEACEELGISAKVHPMAKLKK